MKKTIIFIFLIIILLLFLFSSCDRLTTLSESAWQNSNNNGSSNSNGSNSNIPSNGLVGEWLFNGNANDTSGNGNNGTVNSATLTTDRFGNANSAYSFNGVNNYIVVNNSTSLNLTIGTWCAWVYPTSVAQGLVFVKDIYLGPNENYALGFGTNKAYAGAVINSNLYSFGSNNSIPVNTWTFIACVFDGTKLSIYINGTIDNSSSISGNLAQNTNQLYIGCDYNNPGAYYNGKIDDIRIYNRALSDAEIQSLYNSYSTDFSTDPGWITSNSSRFYWNSVSQDYYINLININGGGNYAVKDMGTNMQAKSFQLNYDIYVTSVDYGCALEFGLFDTDMNFSDNGSFIYICFNNEDRGNQVLLASMNSNNISYVDSSAGSQYSFNTWYHVTLNYNNSTGQVNANIINRGTGITLRTLSTTISGSFSSDMDRVGTSNIRTGNYQVPGATAQGYIDNVQIYLY